MKCEVSHKLLMHTFKRTQTFGQGGAINSNTYKLENIEKVLFKFLSFGISLLIYFIQIFEAPEVHLG